MVNNNLKRNHTMPIRIIFFFLLTFSFLHSLYSQTTVNIANNKGPVITNRNEKTIYKSTPIKANVLSVNKFIDTAKKVWVIFGNGKFGITSTQLRDGFNPFYYMLMAPAYKNILTLKIANGALNISCEVDGFDNKYVARVKNNKLIAPKDYHLNATDKYFELFDDYFTPVLQIELIKESNSIYLGGVFNQLDGYVTISKSHGTSAYSFGESKLLMSQQKRDSVFNEYLKKVKVVKPIHEE